MSDLDPAADPAAGTRRDQRKADRRRVILRSAARLFAERGYRGVSMRDLGAAADVSGPAIYRHFASKQDVLVELLVGISERLLEGGRRQVAESGSDREALERLVAAHAEFAVTDTDLIRVQDRDMSMLPPDAAHTVRRLQRSYVEVWVDALRRLDPALPADRARIKAHAAFGLLNSTPYSARSASCGELTDLLTRMTLAALA
ncbi:TetR/AcrR family transcriptional regulator [Rhodococcus sp. D2-41]|uniref:TetR/AcrR family transcriptional regulator n=1 Tax=Speluncibacter jeojiensis TaxID=2710754 RepID=A0A9X4RHF2_9ACTN|nr:TetR/AcrR family transcriptional regulator [Rhodococcus sp. D2-41]MDG3011624.1 TetR/AcrR family transcriptional regulator [Rhodococcus sp. D2-41]MDG3015021.1 TetR/AcrR family transcriptional regulator [Corynebacteriales bacterium D3-21]